MIKSIKINLFDTKDNQILQDVKLTNLEKEEAEEKEIKICISDKHLNDQIIKSYINFLTQSPNLPEIKKSSSNVNYLLHDNIKNLIDNYYKIDDCFNEKIIRADYPTDYAIAAYTGLKNDPSFTQLLPNKNTDALDQNTLDKLESYFKHDFKHEYDNRIKLNNFSNLVSNINKNLKEINDAKKRSIDSNIDSDEESDEEKFYKFFKETHSIYKPKEIFTNDNAVKNLFEFLDDDLKIHFNFNHNTLDRYNLETENIIKQFFQYCFPNKNYDLSRIITIDERKTIITFYNIYFILKNYYLIDDNVIKAKKDFEDKNYFIKDFNFLDFNNENLNDSNFNSKEVIKISKKPKENIDVYFQCILNIDYKIPELNIKFDFIDIESKQNINNANKKLVSFKKQLYPIMTDISLNNYKKFYINIDETKIDYKNPIKSYKSVLQEFNNKNNKKLLTQKDFFLDLDLTYEFNRQQNIYSSSDQDKSRLKSKNIKFFLINHLNLLNKKLFYNNNYYLIDEIFRLDDSADSTTKFLNVLYENNDIELETTLTNKEVNTLYLLFYVYKLKNKDEKLTLKREIISKSCINNAIKLDSYFKDTIYKTLKLNEDYLFTRFKYRGGKKKNNKSKKQKQISIKNKKQKQMRKEEINKKLKTRKKNNKMRQQTRKLLKKYNFKNLNMNK